MALRHENEEFNLSEIRGSPSTNKIKIMRDCYLSEPLMIDVEYIKYYTFAHKKTDGLNVLERRAECHSYALEHLTPVIREAEPFVGSKTRFVRGAIPYCNYACQYIRKEFSDEVQDAQDKIMELGTGGGVAKAREMAKSEDYTFFGGKFLLLKADREILRECAEYFQGKCMQDVGDALWKTMFEKADYIEKGWQAGLYTAPHDPAPEGRYVLDFETALSHGFNRLIEKMKTKTSK